MASNLTNDSVLRLLEPAVYYLRYSVQSQIVVV
jgi:hypothetical protein